MRPRERVLRTIHSQETDRIPFDMIGREKELVELCQVESKEKLFELLGIDVWRIAWENFNCYVGEKRYYKGLEADLWGVPLVCKEGDSNELCPLFEVNSLSQLEKYKFPSVKDFDFSRIAKEAEEHGEYFVIGGVWAPIFHNFVRICGFENGLVNMMTEPELSAAILGKITDFWIDFTKAVLDAGKGKIDCIYNCNDFGTQRGLLMSPDISRELIKPQLKRFYDVIHSYDAYVYQHSCGAIADIIPDLIEIGADILDPIQVTAAGMSPESISERFAGKIVLHGGIDTQNILPFGSEEEVRLEVRKVIKLLNAKGKYILCGSQEYMKDIPLKNILAVYDEAKKIFEGDII